MGPGSFDPGNPAETEGFPGAAVLQWGRGLLTPEIRRRPESTSTPYRFNGAGVF